MSKKVKAVLAFPRSRRKYGYYLNNNFTDKHSMDRDEFYLFLASLVNPPNTVRIKEYIDKNKNFLVDAENDAVAELQIDPNDRIQKQKEHRTIKTKSILKIWKRRNQESNDLYQRDIKNIQKKSGVR